MKVDWSLYWIGLAASCVTVYSIGGLIPMLYTSQGYLGVAALWFIKTKLVDVWLGEKHE